MASATTAATLQVDIVTDASKAVAGFKKMDAATAQTAQKTSSAGSKIAQFGKVIAGAYAVKEVISFGKESVTAAENAGVANARLAAIFKNQGDATGEAAKQAEDYADSLGKQIGIAPPIIEGAQGILAAFKSVGGAVGRSSGVFNQATKAAADLAAAGFGNLTGNAKLLGKALSDPIKATALLKRSGVVLTAAQQKQIATMEKQGNLLGAQKALLGDVNQAVGGTAAATATAGSKMSVAFEEVQVKIGQVLLPWVLRIKGAILDLINFITANSGWLTPLAIGIGILGGAIYAVNLAMKIWQATTKAAAIVQGIFTAAVNATRAAMILLDLAFAISPIGLIILAIVALVAVLVVLYLKVKVVRDFMNAAWKLIASTAVSVWHTILSTVSGVFSWITSHWPLLLAIITGPFGLAVLWIINHWSGIVSFFSGIVASIEHVVAGVFRAIISPFESAYSWIINNVVTPLGRAFDGVKQAVSSAIGFVKSIWNPIADAINAVHLSLKVPSFVPGIGGKGFDWRPHVPRLATGGVFDRATLAVVGEGSGREIVTPEALLRKIVGSGGNVTINVHVPVSANPAEVGRQTLLALRAYTRANGPIRGLTA